MRSVVVVLWFLFFLSGCASTPPAGEEIPDDLRAAAEAGEIAAQRVLGERYLTAAEPNPALAAHWLLRAAREPDTAMKTRVHVVGKIAIGAADSPAHHEAGLGVRGAG